MKNILLIWSILVITACNDGKSSKINKKNEVYGTFKSKNASLELIKSNILHIKVSEDGECMGEIAGRMTESNRLEVQGCLLALIIKKDIIHVFEKNCMANHGLIQPFSGRYKRVN